MLENYIKTVLYAYPLLKTVEEDYTEHIRNKAVLSYRSNLTTEALAEYLAEEILRKDHLVWLKQKIESVVHKLSEAERDMIAVRYFGKQKKIQAMQEWGERKYFRFMQRLSEKIGGMLEVAGITKQLFDEQLMDIDIIRKIHRFVEEGKERKIS